MPYRLDEAIRTVFTHILRHSMIYRARSDPLPLAHCCVQQRGGTGGKQWSAPSSSVTHKQWNLHCVTRPWRLAIPPDLTSAVKPQCLRLQSCRCPFHSYPPSDRGECTDRARNFSPARVNSGIPATRRDLVGACCSIQLSVYVTIPPMVRQDPIGPVIKSSDIFLSSSFGEEVHRCRLSRP